MNTLCIMDWNSYFLKILSFFVVAFVQEAQGGCKNMILLLPKHGHYLRHHSVQNISDVTEDVCQMKCYMHAACVSYNYCIGSATCEINNSDHHIHRHDLVRKEGYVYRGTDNACKSSPCPSNAICQANFYTQSYSCFCHPGFSGPHCTDIDECQQHSYNCSIKHYCVNTAGSYDCVCKSGYQAHEMNCVDIDECVTNTHNCSDDGSTCNNTEGSFECRCKDGYKMFNNLCTKIFGDYVITVYTADVLGAGTDANVFIRLHGSHFNAEKTSSDEVQLSGRFEQNRVDTITINNKLQNMQSLSYITMRHDNTGSSPVWNLKQVIVDNKTRRMKYTFTCNCKLGKSILGGTHPFSIDIVTNLDNSGRPIVTRY